MNPALRPILLLPPALLLLGCGDSQTGGPLPAAKALALVDGAAVTKESFLYWWKKEARSEDTPEARSAVLDRLIERATLVQRARAAGLDQDPAIVEAIKSLLIAKLNEVELQPALASIRVTPEELRGTYEAVKDQRFREPATKRVALLWFDTRGQQPLADRYRPRLEHVRQLLIDEPHTVPAADGFARLAIANSEHRATRFKGGDLGWISPHADRIHAAAAGIASGLTSPGQLSEVVVRDEGVFLVRLIELRKAHLRKFAEVRDLLERELLAEKRRAVENAFAARMSGGIEVVRLHENLSSLPPLPVTASDPRTPQFVPQLTSNPTISQPAR